MIAPHIIVSGEAHDRGVQFGRAAPDRIRRSIAIYEESFAHAAGLSWDQVRERAMDYGPPIDAYDADLYAEIAGMAEGAGLPLADLLAINARTEIMFASTGTISPECTALGARGSATVGGTTLVAQNWDWRPAVADSVVLLETRRAEGPDLLTYVEAGQLAKIGCNEAGIALAANLLLSDEDVGEPGVPFHVILREILQSASFSEAVDAITRPRRASSANFLVGSSTGELIDIEARPGGPNDLDVLEPTDDMLWHANSFCGGWPVERDRALDILPDAPARTDRMRELLFELHGRLDVAAIQALLRDHDGHPASICRHPDPGLARAERLATMGSVVIDLATLTMHLALGQPCSAEYTPVTAAFATSRA